MYSQDKNSTPGFNYDFRIYNAYSFPTPHIHKSAELILPLSGRGEVLIGNRNFTLNEGEAALALPFVPHSFESGSSKLAVCVFSEDCAPRFYKRLGSKRSGSPVFRPTAAAICYFLNAFEADRQIPAGSTARLTAAGELSVTAALYALLDRFLSDVSFDSEPGIYEKLLDYISEHSSEDLTLASIAAKFGYEPHYLSRLFRRFTDLNLRALINSCRVESAKELLKSDATITEIALSCGFGSVRNFNRVFAKLCKMSPGNWRKSK